MPSVAGVSGAQPTISNTKGEISEFVRNSLEECGWRDQVATMCKDVIQRSGIEQVDFGQICLEVKSEALQMIPEKVKNEALEMMKKT